MLEKEHIEREAAILSLLDKGQHSRRYKLGEIWELDFEEIREAIKSIPAADVVPRKAYTELQAENCRLKNQVWLLKKKIREMKSDASWDEDIRRGQVQGMW